MRMFAYIGPGAGFVLSGSFLLMFTTVAAAVISLMAWPLRIAWRAIQSWRHARL